MVQGVQRGRFKRSNVELEVTLMRGCIPDVLVEPPPPIGTSSLPIEALERSLGTRQSPERCLASRNTIDECHATTVPASADLLRLRKQLHRQSGNASISILALGASVTFMFADMCTEHDSYMCSTGPHETMQTFEMRLQRLRKQRGKLKFAEEADWLVQLLRTLKHGMPTARLSARSVAYGGMNPKAVAACVADFVAAPPADQQARAGSAANLVLLDFAIFGGVHPHSEDWHAIESLVRALYTMNVAVIMINMPTWCLGRTGRREGYVHGHSRCQRMIFNRTQSRANVGSAIIPDRYDDQLTRVAIHYGQTAISVFNALQPEIASGSVDLLDFTHDGKHPIMFPRGTRRGCIPQPLHGRLASACHRPIASTSKASARPSQHLARWRAGGSECLIHLDTRDGAFTNHAGGISNPNYSWQGIGQVQFALARFALCHASITKSISTATTRSRARPYERNSRRALLWLGRASNSGLVEVNYVTRERLETNPRRARIRRQRQGLETSGHQAREARSHIHKSRRCHAPPHRYLAQSR